jgi:hypothetical protein
MKEIIHMETTIKELQPRDHNWITTNAEKGRKICEHYGIPSASQISPKIFDKVFQTWWNDKGNDRVSENDIVNCLGCLFGEYMRMKFGMEWKIITDKYGTDLALQVEHGENIVEVAPLSFVAKRVEADDLERGIFQGMESLIIRQLGNAR